MSTHPRIRAALRTGAHDLSAFYPDRPFGEGDRLTLAAHLADTADEQTTLLDVLPRTTSTTTRSTYAKALRRTAEARR
ncbi:hypothetical protein [Streptomyces sp. NPDC048442]|uniref:hypothetical protein n=1 Tax=Streptomyces sp. NPDC048442 TaxID=3154823 RepID=UPI00343E0B5A